MRKIVLTENGFNHCFVRCNFIFHKYFAYNVKHARLLNNVWSFLKKSLIYFYANILRKERLRPTLNGDNETIPLSSFRLSLFFRRLNTKSGPIHPVNTHKWTRSEFQGKSVWKHQLLIWITFDVPGKLLRVDRVALSMIRNANLQNVRFAEIDYKEFQPPTLPVPTNSRNTEDSYENLSKLMIKLMNLTSVPFCNEVLEILKKN